MGMCLCHLAIYYFPARKVGEEETVSHVTWENLTPTE